MKRSIAYIILSIVSITMHAQEIILPAHDNNQLVEVAHTIGDGIVLSSTTATLYQPFATIKNELQQGKPLKELVKKIVSNPSTLYSGYPSTLTGMLASTALQPPMKAIIEQFVPGDKSAAHTQLTTAFLAGCASAITAAPCELMMIQRQKNPTLSYNGIIKNIIMSQGAKTAWRALPVTALREGGFSIGYLALTDIIASKITDSDNPVIRSTAGGIPAGIIAALSTHPFDTIKTRMQSNLSKKEYKTLVNTLMTIVQKDGLKGLYAGAIPRMTACMVLIPFMSWITQELKSMHE